MLSEQFDLSPHENRWFTWAEVEECFWPGQGGRSHAVNPSLANVRNAGGIYCIAWGTTSKMPTPDEQQVQYIGQTKNFKARMAQFASSAGIFWDDRYDGHSAAWRWPQGATAKMMIAFFPLSATEPDHMNTGRLFWYEALAINLYFIKHDNRLPPLNVAAFFKVVVVSPVLLGDLHDNCQLPFGVEIHRPDGVPVACLT